MEKEQFRFINDVFAELDDHYDKMITWRRYLHQHPELSFKEVQTAKFIEEKLVSFGLEVKSKVGGNGIIGILRGKYPGKTIAFRADFDALAITDEKDVPYKSMNPGVMHACGHDGHTAALLGTAKVLCKYREQIKGNIVFIFQHAEEVPPGGAKFMIEEKILDEVDYVFAAHLSSGIPIGEVAVGSGKKRAAVDKFKIIVEGKGGHGASPQETIDSIVIGSEIVNALQTIVSRKLNPLDAAVVTIGVFQAGSAFNIIADKAQIEGTVRTLDKVVRKQIKQEIYSIVQGITKAHNASYNIEYLNGYPALFNHQEETEVVRKLLTDVFSPKSVHEMEPSMGAEDFSYFLEERPGTYFQVGSRNKDKRTHYQHHHPKFDFDERALLNITKSFVKIVSHYLL